MRSVIVLPLRFQPSVAASSMAGTPTVPAPDIVKLIMRVTVSAYGETAQRALFASAHPFGSGAPCAL